MKYILVIVLVLVAGTALFVLQPKQTFTAGKSVPEPRQPAVEIEQPLNANVPDTALQDERRIAMENEYEKLKKARRNLELRLNRLKAILWDVELPMEQSKEITEQMKSAYALLKNRRMMGAYSGPQEISEELSRLEYAYENLEKTEEMARMARENRKDGTTG